MYYPQEGEYMCVYVVQIMSQKHPLPSYNIITESLSQHSKKKNELILLKRKGKRLA